MKLSKIKNRPKHVLSYRCPECGKEMGSNLILSQPYQWWSCDSCKKTYELSFRELKGDKND